MSQAFGILSERLGLFAVSRLWNMPKQKMLATLVSYSVEFIRGHLLNFTADRYKPQLSVEDIENILGIEKYDEEIAEKTR